MIMHHYSTSNIVNDPTSQYFVTHTGKILDEEKPKGESPQDKKFSFGNGTIFVLNSLMSTLRLPGKREPLKKIITVLQCKSQQRSCIISPNI